MMLLRCCSPYRVFLIQTSIVTIHIVFFFSTVFYILTDAKQSSVRCHVCGTTLRQVIVMLLSSGVDSGNSRDMMPNTLQTRRRSLEQGHCQILPAPECRNAHLPDAILERA